MNDDVILKVTGLKKRFKIYHNPWDRAIEWASLGKIHRHTDYWAMRDVSFEVHRGQFIGVIGENGAGKSTLLKIITGVLVPTAGKVEKNGRIASLLELGTGMDPDLTGRENIIRSAQIEGFPADFIQKKMAEIQEYSELGDFFDRPQRLYSKGMRMRLSFSLFAFLDCEMLILDEVLGVGDIFFRQKCYARLEELIAKNTAILLVSHNMGDIQHYCQDVIVMHKGEMVYQGPAEAGIQTYLHLKDFGVNKNREDFMRLLSSDDGDHVYLPEETKAGFGWPSDEVFAGKAAPRTEQNSGARLIRLAFCDKEGHPVEAIRASKTAVFHFEFELDQDIAMPVAEIAIRNNRNILIHSKDTLQLDCTSPAQVRRGDRLRFSQSITLDLAPAEYTFDITLMTMLPDDYEHLYQANRKDVRQSTLLLYEARPAGALIILPLSGGKLSRQHGGMCDLPGKATVKVMPGGAI
jgi:lipopolysaccharide transport system ATP-binding protein